MASCQKCSVSHDKRKQMCKRRMNDPDMEEEQKATQLWLTLIDLETDGGGRQ